MYKITLKTPLKSNSYLTMFSNNQRIWIVQNYRKERGRFSKAQMGIYNSFQDKDYENYTPTQRPQQSDCRIQKIRKHWRWQEKNGQKPILPQGKINLI